MGVYITAYQCEEIDLFKKSIFTTFIVGKRKVVQCVQKVEEDSFFCDLSSLFGSSVQIVLSETR